MLKVSMRGLRKRQHQQSSDCRWCLRVIAPCPAPQSIVDVSPSGYIGFNLISQSTEPQKFRLLLQPRQPTRVAHAGDGEREQEQIDKDIAGSHAKETEDAFFRYRNGYFRILKRDPGIHIMCL